MKKAKLISIITLLVWFAASNHCFLEEVFLSRAFASESDVLATPESPPVECPAHSADDHRASHQEGAPCGGAVLASGGAKLEVSQAQLVPLFPLPLIFSVETPTILTISASTPQVEVLAPFVDRAFLSLSLASNAPPPQDA